MERGFTLVETLIVAAIVITMAAVLIAMPLGARPFGTRSGIDQFDAFVAYARAVAATSGNGATIVVTPRTDAQGEVLPGFSAKLYAGRPNSGAMQSEPIPAITSSADIAEAALGPPPFSIFFNSSGHATGMKGAVTPSSMVASEPQCPGGGTAMTLRFSDPRAAQIRTLACPKALAGAPSPP